MVLTRLLLLGVSLALSTASCQRQAQSIESQPATPDSAKSDESSSSTSSSFDPYGGAKPPVAYSPATLGLESKAIIASPSPSPSAIPQKPNTGVLVAQAALTTLPSLLQCMSQQCDPGALFGAMSGPFLDVMAKSGENGAMIAQTIAPLMGMFMGGGQ